MLRLRQPQLSLIGDLLPAELRKLSDELAEVDRCLDDDRFMAPFLQRFNTKIGRPTIPVERYLRLMYLKFRYGFGYERLVAEVSDSINWRLFCRMGLDERVPHSTTLVKLTRKYGNEIVKELNECLVKKLAEEKLVQGRKLRTDTTVVAANIEHPTDSDLLHDGMRYIDRCAKSIGKVARALTAGFRSGVRTAAKIAWNIGAALKTKATENARELANSGAAAVADGKKVVEQAAAVAAATVQHVGEAVGAVATTMATAGGQVATFVGEATLQIAAGVSEAAAQVAAGASEAVVQMADQANALVEQLTEVSKTVARKGKAAAKQAQVKVSATRQRVDELTRQMAELATKTVQQGETVLQRVQTLREKASRELAKQLEALEAKLTDALAVTRGVLQQTAQRLAGVASIPNRLISIFDREARPIRRGKLSQPVEFGYKVEVTEVEGGIVSNYEVFVGNPPDSGMAVPVVEHHKKQFGHAPHAVATDMGYSSVENELELKKRGVKHVAMPARGKPDAKRKKHEAQSWFHRLQRWRTGCEATISDLKRRYHMDCSLLWGLDGTSSWVGFAVLTRNLRRVNGLKAARSARAAERSSRKATNVSASTVSVGA